MFTFAWAYLLLLLPLLWIVQKYFPSKQSRQEAMLRVPFLSRLEAFTHPSSIQVLPNNLKQIYALCAWSFLIIACANPQWIGEPQPIDQEGRNILLAVDLSRSMAIPDLQRGNKLLNRLQSVKTVAAGFIDKRQGDKLGLILFGSKGI